MGEGGGEGQARDRHYNSAGRLEPCAEGADQIVNAENGGSGAETPSPALTSMLGAVCSGLSPSLTDGGNALGGGEGHFSC